MRADETVVERTRPLTREELEFLPAALEVIETPPSPAAHALLWLLISLFSIAVIWSVVGRLDEVAVASGKVIPSGYTRVVQAEDKGVVASIRVRNGSSVKKGDLLIGLESTATAADVARLEKERSHYALTLLRLNAEAENRPFEPDPQEHGAEEVARHATLYAKRTADHASRLDVAEKSARQAAEALKGAKVGKDRLKVQLKMAEEREEKTRNAAESGGISHFTWREYLEKVQVLRQDLTAQDSEIGRIGEALSQARAEIESIRDERDREISEQIVDASHRLRLAEEELKKARERYRLTRIVSPVDGVVQQLSVHTSGGVVLEAERLMQIVPSDEGIRFEAWALNRDIGFLHEGQTAEIKVETFSFQKYGTLDAVVESVATEAVEDERRGLIYRVLLSSERDYFIVGDKKVSLIPGMAVTAEIRTRRKRVIEYFLEPFRTYVSEGLRER